MIVLQRLEAGSDETNNNLFSICISKSKREILRKICWATNRTTEATRILRASVYLKRIICTQCILEVPTDGVSTLPWWWSLSAPEPLRAMPAVA
jgi:hypothetical protein